MKLLGVLLLCVSMVAMVHADPRNMLNRNQLLATIGCVLFPVLHGQQLCDLDLIPVQSHFDMDRFLGTWYEVERTELQWGDHTWHSAIWTLFRATNGTYYFSYTGFASDTGCPKPETGFFTETNLDVRLVMTSEAGHYELTFQVAYTDHVNIALVYMCYEPLRLGVCHKNKLHVAMLSRHHGGVLTSHQRYTLAQQLEPTCLTEADIKPSNTGLCVAPTPDPTLIG